MNLRLEDDEDEIWENENGMEEIWIGGWRGATSSLL
jgi:hypothetical protein